MQGSSDFSNYLGDCISQLDAKLKEFKSRAEANKRKKGGSKNDAAKRSAEQVHEHKKMLQRLAKLLIKDPHFESDNVIVY